MPRRGAPAPSDRLAGALAERAASGVSTRWSAVPRARGRRAVADARARAHAGRRRTPQRRLRELPRRPRAERMYTGVLYEALGLTDTRRLGPSAGPGAGRRSCRRCTALVASRRADRAVPARRRGEPARPRAASPRTGAATSTRWSARRAGTRAGRRPPVLDVRRVLAAGGRPRAPRGHGPGAARGEREAAGGEPLQQGHQGPARPRCS